MKIKNLTIIFVIITLICISEYNQYSYAISIEGRDKEGKLIYSGGTSDNQNRFEIGTIGLPIIISYALLFVLGLIFFKMKSNKIISKIFSLILHFEINKKIAFVIVSCLVFIFIISNVNELWNPKEISRGDYQAVLYEIKNYSNSINPSLIFGAYLRFFTIKFSNDVLGNIRILPFIESISLLILTYFLTKSITKKRFSGVIATTILIQSKLFLENSVSATEDNLWTLLYVLSLYLIIKKWYLSPISFLFSLISKALVIIFIPMSIFFTYRSVILKSDKVKIYTAYTLIIIILLIAVFVHQTQITSVDFSIEKFTDGFKVSSSWLRSDFIVALFLLPLIVALFARSRKGIIHADSIMFLIAGVMISAPLLIGVTDITNQPYRFVPLIVFFAVGIGVLFSNNYEIPDKKTRMISTLVFLISFVIVTLSTISMIFPALIHTSSAY